MILYTIPECQACDEMKFWAKENDIQIEEILLTKIEDEWHEKSDDGFIKFDPSVHNFPALLVGENKENQNVFVIGKEGIQSILSKGYIYESKTCPYLNQPCLENKCGKFVIMTKGLIHEGGCGDYWTPILLTSILTKEK